MEINEVTVVTEGQHIAPCGMNCSLCIAYQRDKNKCHGCNGVNDGKPIHCIKCRIKNCETISCNNSKLCYECDKFPCRRLRELDKRYSTKYSMSMIDNLLKIKQEGVNAFIEKEREKWTCKDCGNLICVHRGYCIHCNKK